MASSTPAAAAASTVRVPATPCATAPQSYTSLSHSIEKLDRSMAIGKSKYVPWWFHVLAVLNANGLARAMEDNPADESSTASASMESVNHQAFTIISLNISDSQIPHI